MDLGHQGQIDKDTFSDGTFSSVQRYQDDMIKASLYWYLRQMIINQNVPSKTKEKGKYKLAIGLQALYL